MTVLVFFLIVWVSCAAGAFVKFKKRGFIYGIGGGFLLSCFVVALPCILISEKDIQNGRIYDESTVASQLKKFSAGITYIDGRSFYDGKIYDFAYDRKIQGMAMVKSRYGSGRIEGEISNGWIVIGDSQAKIERYSSPSQNCIGGETSGGGYDEILVCKAVKDFSGFVGWGINSEVAGRLASGEAVKITKNEIYIVIEAGSNRYIYTLFQE